MAAPISSYDLLKPLSDSSKISYEFESMRKALEGFNLYVFIIHDPKEHSDFDREMSRIFDRLDYLTGKKLLFFSLIDPPEEWLVHGRSREYFKYLGNGKALVSPNPENTITSTDKELTAFSLAKSLNIPIEMLPCIVITPDFCSSNFDWVRTCENHIQEQLTDLGYEASRITDKFSYIRMKKAMMQEINLCEGSGSESLESSLAQALIEVLSFIIDSNDPEVQKRVDNTKHNLLTTLTRIKCRIKLEQNSQSTDLDKLSDLDRELDSLCEKIVTFLAHLNTQPQQNLDDFININTSYLEVDSRLILKTSHMVNDFLENAHTRLVDYTAVVICLAKVFEREVNLSVVHFIRQELGVKLPDFFNKHQSGVQAIFNHHNRAIDFNRGDNIAERYRQENNKWNPPAIGESQIAYSQQPENMGKWLENSVDFLKNWDIIRNIRNQAAHTQVVDEQSVSSIKNTLNQLASDGIFGALHKMKTIGRKHGF